MSAKQRKTTVVGNWKMFGTQESLVKLTHSILLGVQDLSSNIVLCPPFVYLGAVQKALQEKTSSTGTVLLGAQNAYCENEGAFTGEISPSMLKDMGCQYVILGHSERRHYFAEADTLIARKFNAAYYAGLTPILCVGETLKEREQGETLAVIRRQLQAVFETAPPGAFTRALIAYEPVWAIGTGQTATPEQAEAVHADIRAWFAKHDREMADKLPILYGGSVKASNAEGLFAQANIDGALVGGASLQAQEFISICRAAATA